MFCHILSSKDHFIVNIYMTGSLFFGQLSWLRLTTFTVKKHLSAMCFVLEYTVKKCTHSQLSSFIQFITEQGRITWHTIYCIMRLGRRTFEGIGIISQSCDEAWAGCCLSMEPVVLRLQSVVEIFCLPPELGFEPATNPHIRGSNNAVSEW